MIGRLLAWIVLGAGLLVGSQFAHLSDLYIERLLGRLDELHRAVQTMRAQAQEAGLDLDAWIAHFEQSDDQIVHRDGVEKRATLARAQQYEDDAAALTGADLVHLPIEFVRRVDHDMLRAVVHRYEPAFPAGLRGFVYTGVGALVGLIFGALLSPRRKRRFRRT
ncbi:DUF2937 family protein [Roseiterribacter gracilis]|uniref:DUF2937 domain-containing protein n=1 Tax=Roseiterribacter gracilis TaxID=2812848 RepID=A0A8S8X967_9PROT|nr:hypothetical protein TMPK1_15210 [Rhodospirillales bacterium TMPK1]